jgi:hypothetical protein
VCWRIMIGRPRTRRYGKDTGYKIYGSGRQGGKPYVLFGDHMWHPTLGVGLFRVRLGTRSSFI